MNRKFFYLFKFCWLIIIFVWFINVAADDILHSSIQESNNVLQKQIINQIPERQVDLSRLFSDVSRTFSGIRTILGANNKVATPATNDFSNKHLQSQPLSDALVDLESQKKSIKLENENEQIVETESSLPFASLFGGSNVCFKTCGMEDIQYAARRAGDMFFILKNCIIILTVIILVCSILLTSSGLYLIYYKTKITNNKQNNCVNRQIHNNDNNSAISSETISIQDCNAKHSAPPSFFSSINIGDNGEYSVSRLNYSINNRNNLKNENGINEHYLESEIDGIENRHYNSKDNSKQFFCDNADDFEEEHKIMPLKRNLPIQKENSTQKH